MATERREAFSSPSTAASHWPPPLLPSPFLFAPSAISAAEEAISAEREGRREEKRVGGLLLSSASSVLIATRRPSLGGSDRRAAGRPTVKGGPLSRHRRQMNDGRRHCRRDLIASSLPSSQETAVTLTCTHAAHALCALAAAAVMIGAPSLAQ